MRRRRREGEPRPVIPLAPLIDCVFLLLAYFVVTSSMERPEGELGFQLPGRAAPGERVSVPEEVVVEVAADGRAGVNGQWLDAPTAARYRQLAELLARFGEASRVGGEEPVVTIEVAGEARQAAVVKVLDAAAWAGLTEVRFGLDADGDG